MADIKQLLDGIEKRDREYRFEVRDGARHIDAYVRLDHAAMLAALRAVLDLHTQLPRPVWTGDPDDWCSQCDGQAYPCETVRAITDAMVKSDG